ncbi:MAG: hypothetical protein EAY65_03345 [Alphaproteobacteria bacterium]|nr:MAG: hypothetical protein EAY65_03345 [Alphaproteobacteria bacterium]
MVSLQTLGQMQESYSTIEDQLRRKSALSLPLSTKAQVVKAQTLNQHGRIDVRTLTLESNLRLSAKKDPIIQNNLARGQTMMDVADGGLKEIGSIITKMESLVQQSALATTTTSERAMLHAEFMHLRDTITTTAQTTKFNGMELISGQRGDPLIITPNAATGAGSNLTGTNAAEFLTGTANDDTLNGGAGNDILTGNGGDDLFLDQSQVGFTAVTGRIYDYTTAGSVTNPAQASTIAAGTPRAQFTATRIDYRQGSFDHVKRFLNYNGNTDGNSLTGDTAWVNSNHSNETVVYAMEGFLWSATAGTFTMSIQGNDGFRLRVNNTTGTTNGTNNTIIMDGGSGTRTNTNMVFNQGWNSFNLIYYENTGNDFLHITHNIGGGAMRTLDNTVMSGTQASAVNGDDTFTGTQTGYDIVQFSGNRADHTITQISDRVFRVQDNRVGSPNGTNILNDIDIARFADGDHQFTYYNPKTITLHINEITGDKIIYEVLDARSSALFERSNISLLTQAEATSTLSDISKARELLAQHENYVAGIQSDLHSVSTQHDTIVNANKQSYHTTHHLLGDVPSHTRDYLNQFSGKELIQAQMGHTHEDALRQLLMSSLIDTKTLH